MVVTAGPRRMRNPLVTHLIVGLTFMGGQYFSSYRSWGVHHKCQLNAANDVPVIDALQSDYY